MGGGSGRSGGGKSGGSCGGRGYGSTGGGGHSGGFRGEQEVVGIGIDGGGTGEGTDGGGGAGGGTNEGRASSGDEAASIIEMSSAERPGHSMPTRRRDEKIVYARIMLFHGCSTLAPLASFVETVALAG